MNPFEAQRQAAAGCIVLRKTRKGRVVGLYRADEAGIESDPATPWATVCEDHGGVVCHATRADATSNLPHPEEWCPTCQEQREQTMKKQDDGRYARPVKIW